MIHKSKDIFMFSTSGNSMFPFIRWDDKILVKKMSPEKMRVRDIILFQSNEGTKVCHRIVKIEDKGGALWFQTKGDRSNFCDPLISHQAILGKVIAIKRKKRLVGHHPEKWYSYLDRFDFFFTCVLFIIKKLLVKIIRFFQQLRLFQIILRPIMYKNLEFKMTNEKTNYKFFTSKNNKIISSVYLTYSKVYLHTGWWVWSLQVKPLYRRLGIGKQLMKNLIEFSRLKDLHCLYVNVSKINISSQKLFESLGFCMIPGSERSHKKTKRIYVYMKKDL